MTVESGKNRLIHFDLLRIIAAFSVVMLHCAAQFWYTIPVTQTEWKIANCYDGLFRFGVPIFVMISGALFLGRDVDIKRLYKHNILHLLTVYLVWTVAYGLFECRNYSLEENALEIIVFEILGGSYHLWFLPMLISIYMLLPVLRVWIRNAEKKLIEYFLVLFIVFKIGRETLWILQKTDVVRFLVDLFDDSELMMACSYIGYFVLGYYIVHIGIPKKWHKLIYAAVIPAAVLNIVLDNYMSLKVNQPSGLIYDSFGMFTFVIVVALFLFFTEVMSKIRYSDFAGKLICEVSKATFGIYVLHIGWIDVLEEVGFHSMTVPIGVGIPLLAVVVFVICYVCAALLRRIPVIGKYIC